MYYRHFGLNAAPFKITPDTQLFFSGGNRGLVLEALVYAVTQGEGIVKVVGEVGSGKTMLCRMLEARLSESVEIVYLANPSLSPEMILHAIAFEMRLPVTPQSNRLEVMQALQQSLLAKHTAGKQVVVFVEEAQGMPLETLEEIRLLSNLETTKDKLLQIVLFGQPELDENLSAQHIRQLKERITHSFYLTPLNREEIKNYLYFRMYSVGYGGPHVFTTSAIKQLRRVSQGLMRRINILADKALLAAFSENQHQVTTKHICLAAKDSGLACSTRPIWRWLLWSILLLCGLAALVWQWGVPWWQSGQTQNFLTLSTLNPNQINIPLPTMTGTETTKPADLLTQRLQATQQWLTEANPNAYSIQIMQTNSSADVLQKRLTHDEMQSLLEKLYILQETNNISPLWLVFYGEFATEEQAGQQLKKLPVQILKNKPFVRRVMQLQRSVEKKM